MFGVEINFLTGRYVATSHYNRRLPEWPPHPARLFSALVAEWAVDEDSSEREALEWLESQAPPSIAVSDELPRKVVSYFVPVNDASVVTQSAYFNKLNRLEKQHKSYWAEIEASEGEITSKAEKISDKISKELDVTNLVANPGNTNPKSAEEMLPEGRVKQERFFPSVTPTEPRVTFSWDGTPSPAVLEALDNLLGRVTRLGHSSSLVSCRINAEPDAPSLVPASVGRSLRGFAQGQLSALERKYAEHKGLKPRALPYTEIRYKEAQEPPLETLYPNTVGDWQVFAFDLNSRAVPSTRTVAVTKVFRTALFHYARDPMPEGLTGHKPDGTPTQLPHIGFYALPWVGHEHSDGRIMGLALNIPNSLDANTVKTVYQAINSWEQGQGPSKLDLNFGENGRLSIQRLTVNSELVTLRRSWWRGSLKNPSKKWVTATPMALPTHPGKLAQGKAESRSKAWQRAEEAVVKSCLHVGLPEPAKVRVSLTPFVHGARPAYQYPTFSQKRAGNKEVCRKLLHAVVVFDVPVLGPLALGAGRFLGLGLMLPVTERATGNGKTDGVPSQATRGNSTTISGEQS